MIYIRARSANQMEELIRDLFATHQTTYFGGGDQADCEIVISGIRLNPKRLRLILQYDEDTNDIQGMYSNRMWKQLGGPALIQTVGVTPFLHDLKHPEPFIKPTAPTLHLGFEIEGCVADEMRADLTAYLTSLYPETPAQNLVHSDGSIRPRCRSIEIVTPALPCDDALERLEWLVGTLSIMTDEGLFETNATCGLHVNVSDADSFTKAPRDVRDAFAYAFMKELDVNRWKKTYRRSTNRFCWWEGNPRTIKDMLDERPVHRMAKRLKVGVSKARHWRAINTQHLHAQPTARRIEVRVAGGKDYHAKHDRLRDFLLDILTAAEHAHSVI